MKKLNLIMFFVGLLFITSCQETDIPILDQCGSATVVKKAKKQKGIFRYNSHFNRYAISVAEANTIDVVDVGLVCNAPTIAALPTVPGEGRPVIFSGKFRPSDEFSPIVGTTYYELELSKIEFMD